MDYSDVREIVEVTDKTRASRLLENPEFVLLAVATGQREDGSAYCLYSLGERYDKSEWAPDPEVSRHL